MTTPRENLIEVSVALDAINTASARDINEWDNRAHRLRVEQHASKDQHVNAQRAERTAETEAGHKPQDVPAANRGYDAESRAADGSLWFIGVKARAGGARKVILAKNEGTLSNTPRQKGAGEAVSSTFG
jgi:hypothetical protein